MPALRRYSVGADPRENGTHFRVWAPIRNQVAIAIENGAVVPLEPEGNGFFSGLLRGIGPGALYRIRFDDGRSYPDPASRFQPEGPHGPSEVVDPRFDWTDAAWRGVEPKGQVLYELHIGTFTQEGTWAAAAEQLPELAALGITCLEVMPVHEFPGRFGWGYDGVDLYAPSHLYGTPDDFRRFVDAAHRCGLGVILDVVYNHFGPDGNYLRAFSPDYFSKEHETDWGEALNFDGPNSGPVREFFLENAAYWIADFHLDGLRLDATQDIHDSAPPARHILTEIGRRARVAGKDKFIFIVNENEPQRSELCRPIERGGFGLDALWNDDFHHSALVALTGRREGYYTDYLGTPQELISAAKYGYLYQGQYYSWQKKRRGQPGIDLPPEAFITFIENHDQLANSARSIGVYNVTSPGRYRAMLTLQLLGPGTPMLFQGQEFASSAPFYYFADHKPELAELVAKGRLEFLSQFPSFNDPKKQAAFPAPHDPATFAACKLKFAERNSNAATYRLTRDLLQLRHRDPVFGKTLPRGTDGAVLGESAFLLRFFHRDGLDRLLVVNLGRDLQLKTLPEPLVAPPRDAAWSLALCTEDSEYGGMGRPKIESESDGWFIPGESALAFTSMNP